MMYDKVKLKAPTFGLITSRPLLLFQDSDYLRNHEWLWENFPPDIRFHSVIITGDNVLKPETLKLVQSL